MRKTHRPRHLKSSHSSIEDEIMNLGYFASSSTSSSNLSPLAPPFTVERSNHNKLNSNANLDSRFNTKLDGLPFNSSWPYSHSSTASQGLLADSVRTATVPSANNYAIPNPNDSPTPHNWSAINSTFKSGLEPVYPPPPHLSPVNPNRTESLPFYYQYASILSDDDDDGQSLPGLKYDPQQVGTWTGPSDESQRKIFDSGHSFFSQEANIAGSLASKSYMNQGAYNTEPLSKVKEDSSMFSGVYRNHVARENNIGPSVIGNSHSKPFSATNHGIFLSEFEKEHTFTPFKFSESFNLAHRSYTPFEKISNIFDCSSDIISPSITKSSPSLVIKPPPAVSDKRVEISNPRLNFEFKANSNIQVPEINTTKDVKSAANSPEQLDHHNPGEDSPCWKGAPTHFSSFGSQEAESSWHPMKKLQTSNSVNLQEKTDLFFNLTSNVSSLEVKGISVSDERPLAPTQIEKDQKLPNLNEDVVVVNGTVDLNLNASVENAANLTTENLDVNVLVKALSNLSELLLLHYSKDEYELKEHDRKAIDHVINNLNMCLSKRIQQVNPAPKDVPSHHVVSNRPQDNDLLKDDNMVQTIKKVLDENLECKEDLLSDTLFYKNLWLEAEAELCAFSYKARFHRAKREMDKSKAAVSDVSEVASDVKKISTSILPSDPPKMIHEGAHNNHVAGHIDDVENSVMARFSILKRREESIPVDITENESADVEVSSNEIQSPLQHHFNKDNDVVKMHSIGKQKMQYSEDVDHSVIMARLNILKTRGEPDSEFSGNGSQSSGMKKVKEVEMGMGSSGTNLMPNHFESGVYATYSASSDWEHVLKDEFS